MKVEITQLHGSVYEKDARVKIQQLQKQNEKLFHIVNQCREHKDSIGIKTEKVHIRLNM